MSFISLSSSALSSSSSFSSSLLLFSMSLIFFFKKNICKYNFSKLKNNFLYFSLFNDIFNKLLKIDSKIKKSFCKLISSSLIIISFIFPIKFSENSGISKNLSKLLKTRRLSITVDLNTSSISSKYIFIYCKIFSLQN